VAAPKYRFQLQAYATGGTQTCTNSSTGNTTTSGANFGFAVDTGTQAGDPQTEKVTGANATDQSSPPLNSNWSWTFEP
jgi:carbamoylphosphate synthase small subunit